MFVNRAKYWVSGLAVAAVLLLSASSSSAISFTMAGADGQDVVANDQVSVTVSMDSEGLTGITLLSIGVLFDDTRLSYNQAASSTSSYILYSSTAKNGGQYLSAAATCGGGYPGGGAGCDLRVGIPNQINIDYLAPDLQVGTGATNVGTGNDLLVTLIFDVLDPANGGSAAISLSQTAPGNVIGVAGGSAVANLFGSGSVNVVPEPTTALLVGLGLAGLGVAGRRRV